MVHISIYNLHGICDPDLLDIRSRHVNDLLIAVKKIN